MSAGPTPDMPRKLDDPSTWQYFPISEAFLCAGCKVVHNHPGRCPTCATEHIMSLAAVLGREEKKEEL